MAGLLRRRRGRRTARPTRARAADYGPAISAKLVRAVRTKPEAAQRAAAAMAAWQEAAAHDPPVDVIVSPVLGLAELPAIETPEEEFRIAFSAYARPFNFLGWPAIADRRHAARRARHADAARGRARMAA